jgi:hypothetical protein
MWIPRTPRRPDFCGCPPCPLCFDWASDEGLKIEDGMQKFTRDMLGDRAPSAQEKETLDEAADRVHLGNLNRKIEQEAAQEQRLLAEDIHWIERKTSEIAAQRRAEAARPAPAPPRTVTCDDIDVEDKIAELAQAERERVTVEIRRTEIAAKEKSVWANIYQEALRASMQQPGNIIVEPPAPVLYGFAGTGDNNVNPLRLSEQALKESLREQREREAGLLLPIYKPLVSR